MISVKIKWSGSEYPLEQIPLSTTVKELKDLIKEHTGVLPVRQKLCGISLKGKPPPDECLLSDLKLKNNQKIMMMGTREEVITEATTAPENMPEVMDDFEVPEEVMLRISERPENLDKVANRVQKYEFKKKFNDFREGKKLLVLDIDYTLFDHKSCAERGEELMRPGLHEFLSVVYSEYDIVIWSATSMKWIEAKMAELGVLKNPSFKIAMFVDDGAMITVQDEEGHVVRCKPLGVLWGKFPQFSAKNSVIFDDVRHNFLMAPKSGLKIRAYRKAHKNRGTDRELLKLTRYLMLIADKDFTTLNHDRWERYCEKHGVTFDDLLVNDS